MVDKMALGQVYVLVLNFSHIIPPVLLISNTTVIKRTIV